MKTLNPVITAIATLSLALLIGCGTTSYPSLNGTWTFAAVSTIVPSEPPQHFTGTLASHGADVTGTLTFTNACFKTQAIAYTGNISGANELKLTSAVYNNQQISLTGTLSSDGTLLTAGTYSVAAENSTPAICDQGDTGTLSGSRPATTP